MTRQGNITRTIRRLEVDAPTTMRAYRLRAMVRAYEDAADVLAEAYPMAGELVRVMAMVSQAGLADVLSGQEPPS